MWLAFKALPGAIKIGVLIAILAALAAFGYTMYEKGVNVSAVRIAQYEGKVKDLHGKLVAANAKTNTKFVVQYKDRDRVITQTVVKNHETIVSVVPEQFKMSKGWIYAYNQSVLGMDIDPKLASNKDASSVTDKMASSYINDNNGICLANSNQLDNLIGDVKEFQQNAKDVNK